MLKRLGLGLVIGVVLGALLGYGLSQLGTTLMAGALGYVFAAVTGVVVGLVAGKPIWAKGAGVEAGLKAGIGALLGCALLFGLRFLSFTVPGIAGVAEAAPIGHHPIGALVAISTLLAVFYELDNSGGDDDIEKHAPTRKRIEGNGPASKKGARIANDDALDDEAPAKKKGKA